MRYLLPLMVLPALLLCGFAPEKEPDVPPPEKEAEKKAEKKARQGTDMTEMMVNNIKEVSYLISVHKDPKAGQYWETQMEGHGMTMTTRWQVAKVDGSTATIEHQNKSEAEWGWHDYVIVYQIDLSKEEGKANVTSAWIGATGKQGKKVDVMKAPKDQDDDPADYKQAEEDFADLELAGKKWSGKKMTTKGEGWESNIWMATDGWFGGMIKMEAAGMVTQLTAFGTDAKSLLTLPQEDAKTDDAPKKDAPKEAPKDTPKE